MASLTDDMTRLRDEIENLRQMRHQLKEDLAEYVGDRKDEVVGQLKDFHAAHQAMARSTKKDRIGFIAEVKARGDVEVFGVSGAAAVYRRAFLDDARVFGQAFDEAFFAYREDADLAWRGRLFGWKAIRASAATAWHVRRVTPEVRAIIKNASITDGLVTVFCPGSTGAVTTIEYESGVLQDLSKALERIAPSDIPYSHDRRWGDGNGFAHLRSALIGASVCLPVVGGRPVLGTWQQVVLCDSDNRPRTRRLAVTIVGEGRA